MAETNLTLLHNWFEEVWNKGREEAIDEWMAPDAIAHGILDADGNEIRGREAFKAFFHSFRGAFPDIQVTIEDTVAAHDKVLVRCVVKGAHQGGTLGFAATNKRVSFTGMCLARVENEKIVEAWNNFDFLTMYQQLGVAPPGLA